MKELVSILIPVYNCERFLHRCLDSVALQTYRDLQILVVDDGSTDGSFRIISEYASSDSRFEIFHHENRGVSSARKELLSYVKGEYFLFVDADDWIEPDTIDYLLGKATECGSDVVVCGVNNGGDVVMTEEQVEIWDRDRTIREFLAHVRLGGSLCNKLIRTSLLELDSEILLNVSYGEDALWCWRIFQNVSRLCLTNRILYHYCFNENSLSRRKWTLEGRGSGHFVWQRIVSECADLWPEYLDTAKARSAIEDALALYFAAGSGCPRDTGIKERQKNVRNNIHLIKSSGLVSFKIVVMAWTMANVYNFMRLFLRFVKI